MTDKTNSDYSMMFMGMVMIMMPVKHFLAHSSLFSTLDLLCPQKMRSELPL